MDVLMMPRVRQVFMIRLATMCISAGISSLLMSPQLSRTRMSVMCGCPASGQRSTEVQAQMQHSRLRARYVQCLVLHPLSSFSSSSSPEASPFSLFGGSASGLSVFFPVFPGVFIFLLFLFFGMQFGFPGCTFATFGRILVFRLSASIGLHVLSVPCVWSFLVRK